VRRTISSVACSLIRRSWPTCRHRKRDLCRTLLKLWSSIAMAQFDARPHRSKSLRPKTSILIIQKCQRSWVPSCALYGTTRVDKMVNLASRKAMYPKSLARRPTRN
ncbi:hypothetical protein LTR95_011059, partial [Oleoguttula sp. CCFEE 5521]